MSDRAVCVFFYVCKYEVSPLDKQAIALVANFFFKLNITYTKYILYFNIYYIVLH